MGDSDSYLDLAQRIEEGFPEIENDIIMDLQESDEDYASLCRKISEFKAAHPIISKIVEGSGDITLTSEEHIAVVEYINPDGSILVSETNVVKAGTGTRSWRVLSKETVSQILFIQGKAQHGK